MDIGPTLGGKNLLHDFSLPNRNRLIEHRLGEFFKEIVNQISLKNIGPMSILQKFSRCSGQRSLRKFLLAAISEQDRQEHRDLQDDQHRVHRNSFDSMVFTDIRHIAEAR